MWPLTSSLSPWTLRLGGRSICIWISWLSYTLPWMPARSRTLHFIYVGADIGYGRFSVWVLTMGSWGKGRAGGLGRMDGALARKKVFLLLFNRLESMESAQTCPDFDDFSSMSLRFHETSVHILVPHWAHFVQLGT